MCIQTEVVCHMNCETSKNVKMQSSDPFLILYDILTLHTVKLDEWFQAEGLTEQFICVFLSWCRCKHSWKQ